MDQPPSGGLEGLSWWIIGGAVGTALAVAVAIITLISIGGEPAPADRAPVPTSSPPAAGSAQLVFEATEFAFGPAQANAAPEVEITLDNRGLIVHNLEIEGVAGFVIEAQPGLAETASVTLEPGSYRFFCSIPGHREAGMEGELTVTG